MKLKNTPVEEYTVKGNTFAVKREDMCCKFPGPSFSKVRGLMAVLKRLKTEGYTHIGYTETSVSMAGWGVAYGCKQLGLKAVIFDPQYKETPDILSLHRRMWKKFKPIILPIKAGRAKVNYYICTKTLHEKYPHSYMLPLGLPFKETIQAAEVEAIKVQKKYNVDTVVVNVGSGTVAAGVAQGFRNKIVYGIMGRSGSVPLKLNTIQKKGDFRTRGFNPVDFRLIDPGWEYTQAAEYPCPFPCHPYYDLKAYQWMIENFKSLKGKVLFWNIGSMPLL